MSWLGFYHGCWAGQLVGPGSEETRGSHFGGTAREEFTLQFCSLLQLVFRLRLVSKGTLVAMLIIEIKDNQHN